MPLKQRGRICAKMAAFDTAPEKRTPAMRNFTTTAVACALLAAPGMSVAAEHAPVPKVFGGAPMQKGAWRIESLDRTTPGGTTVCLDSVAKMGRDQESENQEADTCEEQLLKDTPSEAVMETKCEDEAYTTTIRRESARAFLIEVRSHDPADPYAMKARYSYEGECKPGAGAVTLDSDSAECRKMRANVAQMDPAKLCADAGPGRKQCEEQMRKAREQVESMCR